MLQEEPAHKRPESEFVDEISPSADGRENVAHGPAGWDGSASPPSPQGLRPGLQSSAPSGAAKRPPA